MSKYRFKTQEEFYRDGQWNDEYDCPVGWAESGDMNHYLGQDVPIYLYESCDVGGDFTNDGWYFQPTDYILKEEDYTGRWIKALIDNPQCTSVKLGEVIQIIGNSGSYRLDKTSMGIPGMGIAYPLDTSKWELVEQPKDDSEDILEKARRLYPIGGDFTNDGWYFQPIVKPTPSKEVPEYVKCIEVPEGWKLTKKGTIYKTDKYSGGGYRILYHEEGGGQTTVGKEHCFVPSTKQEYDAQFVKHDDVYPINTEVRIKSNSEFLSQGSSNDKRVKGIIYSNTNNIYVDDHCYIYRVEWSTGKENAYRPIDLELWEEESPEIKDPLYICRQEYRKGMKVKSASKTGVYSKEFIIDVDPKEFRNLSGNKDIVDYSCSKGYLYYKGEYAEILEESDMLSLEIPPISELVSVTKLDMINYNSGIDDYLGNSRFKERNPEAYNWLTKPSIETVQSVDVNLRTKKQINKFKF